VGTERTRVEVLYATEIETGKSVTTALTAIADGPTVRAMALSTASVEKVERFTAENLTEANTIGVGEGGGAGLGDGGGGGVGLGGGRGAGGGG